MARTYVKLPEWDLDRMAGNEAFADSLILSIRDTLRTALDNDGLHTNWLVSDVAKWDGANATIEGYAFIVKHMEGQPIPAPTGKEWLFVFPGRGSIYVAELEDILGSGSDATIGQYFIEVNGATVFGDDGNPAIHYNPTANVTPYNGGWDANGELVGGDLSSPTNSPWSNLNDFMPGTSHPLGVAFLSFTSGLNFAATVWDDEKPFMAFYYTRGRESYIGAANILGETIVPYLASDTFTSGNLYFAFTNTSTLGGNIGSSLVATYNSSGTRIYNTGSIYAHSRYTNVNKVTPEGDYLWDTVQVIYPTGIKGYVDPEIMKVVGEYNGDYLKLMESDGHYFIKISQAIAFPYVQNVPIFPPG